MTKKKPADKTNIHIEEDQDQTEDRDPSENDSIPAETALRPSYFVETYPPDVSLDEAVKQINNKQLDIVSAVPPGQYVTPDGVHRYRKNWQFVVRPVVLTHTINSPTGRNP